MLKLGIFVSGGGTNLQAILDARDAGDLADAEIAFVYSNNKKAYALERARRAGIATIVLSPADFPDRESFNLALVRRIKEEAPDLIVLAGCLLQIPPAMISAFSGRIINIHPSLIPAFCGRGYYGLHVHEKAIERGVRLTGATVHFVDEGMDTGPILLQRAVEVLPDDTPEVLQRRVMEEAEWVLLPQAIRWIARGGVSLREGKLVICEKEGGSI